MLDLPQPATRRPHDLHRGRTRCGLQCPHIRHQAIYEPRLVRNFNAHKPETRRSTRRTRREPAIVSQLRRTCSGSPAGYDPLRREFSLTEGAAPCSSRSSRSWQPRSTWVRDIVHIGPRSVATRPIWMADVSDSDPMGGTYLRLRGPRPLHPPRFAPSVVSLDGRPCGVEGSTFSSGALD
jgi:hypothetical protein